MKKTVVFSFLAFGLIFSLTGCGPVKKTEVAITNEADNSAVNVAAPVETEKGVKKFYPDTGAPVAPARPEGDAVAPKSNFTVTQELVVKLYLVDKYKPGVCYGMPGPVPDEAVSGMISSNQDLVKFLKSRYPELKTDLDVYTKIKQINGIRLTSIAGGKYHFNLTDGECCTLTAYDGEVMMLGQTITDTVLQQETKVNPC